MTNTATNTPYYEDADLHSASDEYAARFSGEAGRWMLEVQEKIVLKLLSEHSARKVLDVGGGHGQIAKPLIKRGYSVKVLASSEAATHQIRDLIRDQSCEVDIGDLLKITSPELHFDLVTCFRLLPHCNEWKLLVKELCRVSRRSVIVDYPVRCSVNALTPLLFGAKKSVEKNTRPYSLFTDREVILEFQKYGFRPKKLVRQFFVPMVLHRMLKNPRLSALLELFPKVSGLTRLFGSPVIAEFVRS